VHNTSYLTVIYFLISVVIRIRKNPKVLAGSESESEKKFGFGYGFGFGSRHCCRVKILWKIADQTLEREKNDVFLLKFFFLWRTGSRTHMKAIRGTIWKNLGSKYESKDSNLYPNPEKNLWIRIRKKWIRIHNTASHIYSISKTWAMHWFFSLILIVKKVL
jgi:hypothetical protein